MNDDEKEKKGLTCKIYDLNLSTVSIFVHELAQEFVTYLSNNGDQEKKTGREKKAIGRKMKEKSDGEAAISTLRSTSEMLLTCPKNGEERVGIKRVERRARG